MNTYSIIASLSACLSCSIGLYILLTNVKYPINILFFLSCSCIAVWSFLASFIFNATRLELLLIFYPASCIAFYFYFPFHLHFSIKLTEIKIGILFYIFIYIVPLILSVAVLTDYRLFSNFVLQNGIWSFKLKYRSFWFVLYITYQFLTVILSVIFLWIWRMKTRSVKSDRISIIMIAANLLTYPLVPYLVFLILKKYHGESLLFFMIWIVCSFYVIKRYYFLSLTPELIARHIISNIDETIILFDNNLDISFMNSKAETVLGMEKINVKKIRLNEVIANYDLIAEEIKKLLERRIPDMKKKPKEFSCRLLIKGQGDGILMDVKFSKTCDSFGDILGISMIGREVKELKQMKMFFKLSERETEIVELVSDGLSNREIGAELGLTENTVKSHVSRIFNKMNVKSRIEMLNLLSEYSLIQRGSSRKTFI
jgi:PAS domain S-box-containing protein